MTAQLLKSLLVHQTKEMICHDYYYRLLDKRLTYGILKACDYVNVPVVAAVAL